ncbi:hypothetical protein [Sorangium sp. So ce388]|uniref:hypothetical protein n=1 Tax=Sorangium sp. So ce388 TaxID=3133309 RepID=UPI003F5C0CF9
MADFKMKTGKNSKGNFYEIVISTAKRYDSEGIGYEFLFRITSRVRHHKRFWPDSARWATHYLDIWYDKPSGGTFHETRSGHGEELHVPLSTSCWIPSRIIVEGTAYTKDNHKFELIHEVREPRF